MKLLFQVLVGSVLFNFRECNKIIVKIYLCITVSKLLYCLHFKRNPLYMHTICYILNVMLYSCLTMCYKTVLHAIISIQIT